ncbi:MAG TPA: helix-turn-helix domain-containing protein [Candidatus Levilactobacillus faecigallinarum]|uniref:Helix-turn-helix domain-containing protein n=1 Tax=Candidatus Levilactobacillus faecigallinarum TaxID=2838638 RepID=A0A9D1QSH2_9LACO|nr:helix-turn-helix domain-containing protein [Candidatus Levilactobacillus faecigallinarum]
MTTYSLRQEDFRQIAHALATFTNLTQIRTILFSFNGILLADDFIYLNPNSVKSTLANQDFTNPSILPVCLDSHLWGVILCETVSVSKKRLMISRSYLEDTINNILAKNTTGKVTVWAPLSSSQLAQIDLLKIFFQSPHSNQTPDNDTVHPLLPPTKTLGTPSSANYNIGIAINYIHKNIQKSLSLNEVAKQAYLSPAYLSRLFKKHLHVNFIEYVNSQKIALAQEKLALSQDTVHEISTDLGFSQTSYFTKLFKRRTGLTPSEFRQHNHSAQKIYTIPRQIDQKNSESVWDASQTFFQNNHIDFLADSDHGSAYVNSIANLGDTDGDRGWVYLVDGQFPMEAADKVTMDDKSVIQWFFTDYNRS